jgi:hypothetical protein
MRARELMTQKGEADLTVRGYAYLLADVQYRTSRTVWSCAGADVLAEGDEQAINFNPVALGQFFFEFH